jgi:hypothetical protein
MVAAALADTPKHVSACIAATRAISSPLYSLFLPAPGLRRFSGRGRIPRFAHVCSVPALTPVAAIRCAFPKRF